MLLGEYLRRQRPPADPTMTNPIGWSSIYPPDRLTNPDPNVSEVARKAFLTPQQQIGLMLMGKRGPNATNADLPAATQRAQTAMDYGMAVAGATSPIRAFHGSPYTFGRFDMSKIGTGEGAQAYGHGLYFAENEGVAQGYKDKLGKILGILDQSPKTAAEREVIDVIKSGQRDLGAIPAMDDVTAWLRSTDNPELFDALDELAKRAKGGSMYEVSLRTSPERLLDWDKPLSQQPEAVRRAMNNIPDVGKVRSESGDAAYSSLQNILRLQGKGDASEAANVLRNAGVDGIQYLDGGSRAAGDGTRNYVMFRDDIIDILRRYGILAAGATGVAKGAAQQFAPEQSQ